MNTLKIFLLFFVLITGNLFAQPVAIIFADPDTGCAPLTVHFKDISDSGGVHRFWYFGNGDTSTFKNVNYTFNNPGNYTVTLVSFDALWQLSDTTTVTIVVGESPNPYFYAYPDPACLGTPIDFYNWSDDQSNAFWDFGDGNTSSEINPSHTYASEGSYPVSLTVTTTACGPNTYTDTVTVGAGIYFEAYPSSACPGEEIYFYNYSANPANSLWNFGDGAYSNQIDPVHTYTADGNYTVTLTVNNSCGSGSYSSVISISSGIIPQADMYVYPDTSCPGDEITFYDMSYGNITGRLWNFGDGTTSAQQWVYHSYNNVGIYPVTLTVTNICGNSDSVTNNIVVTNTQMPVADFYSYPETVCPGEQVSFYDYSIGTIVSWHWNFGDGGASNQQWTSHSYDSAGIYTVVLTVTNSCGNADSIAKTINVDNLQAPVADMYLYPDSVCPGEQVSFYDMSYGNIVSWHWDFGDGATSSQQWTYYSYSSIGNYSVVLTVTNICGNSDTASRTVVVSNTQFPTADFYFYPDSVCPAEAVNFYDYSWGDIVSRLWEFGDGTTSSSAYPVHAYSAIGNYNVTLTVTNSCGNSNSIIKIVTVSNTISPYADFYMYPETACPGDAISFYDYSWGNIVSRLWDFGDDYTSTSQSPIHIYTSTGIYNVTLTVSNYCGVSNSITQTVTITNSLSPTADFYFYPETVCPNEPISFENYSYDYIFSLWDFGDSTTSTQNSPQHSYGSAGAYTVILTVTNNCGNSDTYVTNVTVSNLIIPEAYPYAYPESACAGDIINFYDYSYGSIVSWVWDFGDSTTSAFQNPLHIYTVNGIYNVTLTVQNSCGLSNTGTTSVEIGNSVTPDVWFWAYPDNVCPGDTIYFQDYSSGNIVSWLWDFGDGQYSSLQNPIHVYSANGTYTVILTATNNCGNSGTYQQTINVNSSVSPYVWFWIEPNPVCPGNTVLFYDYSSGATSWLWNFGDGTTSTLQNPSHIYSAPGDYNVSLTVTNSCGNSASGNDVISVNSSVTPWAYFDVSSNTVCPGSQVFFNNYSSDTSDCRWVFGDGDTSFAVNTVHVFDTPGTYDVVLTVYNNCDNSNSYSMSILVTNTAQVEAYFYTFVTSACEGQGVEFYNASSDVSNCLWDFGDGTTSTEINPVHIFITSGSYAISLTVSNSCGSDTYSSAINIIPSPQASFYVSDTTVAAGTTIYFTNTSQNAISFNWNFGDYSGTSSLESPSHSYNTSGIYNVQLTVLGSSGCSDTEILALTVTPVISYTVSKACPGASTGAIDVTVLNGAPPLTYNWSNGATTMDINNLPAGTYTLTVVDGSGTSSNITVTVEEYPPVITDLNGIDVTCSGSNDGYTANVISGGTPPLEFLWSNSSSSENISGLSQGIYYLTVTDSNNCSTMDSININEPAPLLLNLTKTDISCFGAADGTVTSNVSGGTSPYFYLWNMGCTDVTCNVFTGATYTVTVTDANGCVISDTAAISEPPVLSGALVKNDVSCYNGINGSLNLSVSGGTLSYTFSWSNSAVSEDISNLASGIYSVTISDANSCILSLTDTINQPQELEISVNTSNVVCAGGTDGSVDITVTGGTSPYNYSWSTGASVEDINNLTAGIYSISVSDSHNCLTSATDTVIEQNLPFTIITGLNHATCLLNDGKAWLEQITGGGTAPFTFEWNTIPVQYTDTTFNLTAGAYTVIVTSSEGCSGSALILINNIGGPSVDSINISHAACFNSCNGTALVFANSIATPLAYLWSNGQTDSLAIDLCAGTYFVTAADTNNCIVVTNAEINEPNILSSIISGDNLMCFNSGDGSASVVATGGTPPYSYLWSTGAETQSIASLQAGTYYVTINDFNNCIIIDSIAITEPDPLTLSITKTDVLCFGGATGSVNLTISGGTLAFLYVWSSGQMNANISGLTAGAYSVTVNDQNACTATTSVIISEPVLLSATITDIVMVSCYGLNGGGATVSASGGTFPYIYLWNMGIDTQGIAYLHAGTYSVTVTDSNGCLAISEALITQPDQLNSSFTETDISCNGNNDGAIDFTATGGTIPYSYQWSNGATSVNIDSLAAGSYIVTVTDFHGCTYFQTITVSEPSTLNSSISKLDVTCNGLCNGIGTAVTSGGTLPYAYVWSNGHTTQTIFSLCAGNYSVTITDIHGCEIISNVIISEPDSITTVISGTNVGCFGENDGSILLTVTGGTTPYSFNWNNGQTTGSLSGIPAGNYLVTVSDNHSCTAVTGSAITQPALLVVSLASVEPSHCGMADGAACIAISGGTPVYSVIWANGSDSVCAQNLSSGIKFVTITDSHGCTASTYANIAYISGPVITSFDVVDDIDNACTGQVTVNISGGTSPVSFLWNDALFQTTQTASGLCTGIYTVAITDVAGCSVTDSVFVDNLTFLANIERNNGIMIYPNPAEDYCYISIFNEVPSSMQICLTDVTGRNIYKKQNNLFNGEMRLLLPLQNYADGFYFIKVIINNEIIFTEKLIKR
ncbi:MAG: PKD domain-containing protein [Bacteroidia bacterium]|nr:PKD domain-containing protein [Bacteroidia bacterium]